MANNMPPKIRTFALADALIVSAMACCVFATAEPFKIKRPARVVVFRQNSVVAEYPLEDDIAFQVAGKRGPVGIEIKDGAAAIAHSDCPKKICKMSNGIRGTREQLICAPNNILMEIRSAKDTANVDATAY